MGIDGRKTAAIMAVAAAGLAMMASQAAEFTLSAAPETLSDWKNVSFYTGDAAPTGASTDVVNMPAGMTVTVSGTNSDVVAFLGSIARLMANAGAQFILDVPQTASPLEFSGKVQQVDGVKTPAWFIKRGEGDLKLMGTASSAYNVNLHVEKGTVRLPPVASGSYNYYGSVVVDAGATIYTMGTGYWQVRGLHGAGLVTNDNATVCSIYVMSPESIMPWGGAFSGAIGGKLSIMLRNGRLQLTGSGNAISSEITVSSDASYGGAQKATLELAALRAMYARP